MYAKVKLSEHKVIAFEERPPPEIIGLSQESLNDLGAALDPCPSEYVGFGYWPVDDVHPALTPHRRTDFDGPIITVDAPAKLVMRTFPSALLPVDERKAVMIREAKEACAAAVAAGFDHGGHTFQIDDAAQAAMTAVMADYNAGTKNAHGGFWRCADNVNVAMTDAECVTFLKAAKAHKMALMRSMWTRMKNIEDAADHAALEAL